MTDPHKTGRQTRPAGRPFQYGIALVLVVQVVAAVAMGIWRGYGAAGVFAAGVIGGIFALSVVATVSYVLRVEQGEEAREETDPVTRLMAIAAILIGVGLMFMLVFAFSGD